MSTVQMQKGYQLDCDYYALIHSCLRAPPDSVVRIEDTSDNNLGNKNNLT